MRIPKAGRIGCRTLGALLVALSPVLAQTESAPEGSGLRISRSAICPRVEARAPVDEGTSFPRDVGSLFAYTQVEGVTSATHITHVWYHGDTEIYRRDLQIGENGWRTWSGKAIDPSLTGPWRVEILDEGGNTLATLQFTIEEGGGRQEAPPQG
jgi:hypothetical protein